MTASRIGVPIASGWKRLGWPVALAGMVGAIVFKTSPVPFLIASAAAFAGSLIALAGKPSPAWRIILSLAALVYAALVVLGIWQIA